MTTRATRVQHVQTRRTTLLAGLAAGTLVLTACGANTPAASTTTGTSTSSPVISVATSSPATAPEHVTLDFWGWAPGYADAVKQFNATHSGIQVRRSLQTTLPALPRSDTKP